MNFTMNPMTPSKPTPIMVILRDVVKSSRVGLFTSFSRRLVEFKILLRDNLRSPASLQLT